MKAYELLRGLFFCVSEVAVSGRLESTELQGRSAHTERLM